MLDNLGVETRPIISGSFINQPASKLYKLNSNNYKYPNAQVVQDLGFLIGLQLHKDQTNFIKKLMENKLLTIRAAENVVRILPPLNVNKSELDLALKIIKKVCHNY